MVAMVNRKSQMANRSASVPMTLSDLERRDAKGQIFEADPLNELVPFDCRMTKFGRITHLGEQRISRAQLRPIFRRLGNPILGVSFYLCTHPLTQNYQI